MSIRSEYFQIAIPFEQCESKIISLRNYFEYLNHALTKQYKEELTSHLPRLNVLYKLYLRYRDLVAKAYNPESNYSSSDTDQAGELHDEFNVIHDEIHAEFVKLDDEQKMDKGYLVSADAYYEQFYKKNTLPKEMADILKSRAEAGEVVTIEEVNELARIYIK